MTNPYRDLPDHCYWSRAVTAPQPGQIDPVVAGVTINAAAKIATMGSCFAQHLARHVRKSGLNYYIAEPAPEGLSADEAVRRNYGTFSARYGNVYTVRQAVQLFYRAFGIFAPQDDVWPKGSGFVDAFRPQIEPAEIATIDAVRKSARAHLACVREMFMTADWLVFTLGLTEGWASRIDGAVYPVAPGVSGGIFDPAKYEFINFGVDQVRADLEEFITRVHQVNPSCQILLTVSPVPLVATYEQRHVWVSTTYSKAVLRVAADEAARHFGFVHYFPSYEVITSPAAGGAYYQDDLRQVTDLGVGHVMKLFAKHYFPDRMKPAAEQQPTAAAPPPASRAAGVESAAAKAAPPPPPEAVPIVCDEEAIEQALVASGFRAVA